MKENDIIKALHSIIDQQKAEIECLQNELSVVKYKNSDLQSTYQALKIDLESMRRAANEYIQALECALDYRTEQLQTAKTEGIKEFWCRLKKQMEDDKHKIITNKHYAMNHNAAIDLCIAKGDKIAKEMEGEIK